MANIQLTDSTRRSGRATKGQNKKLEAEDTPAKKPTAKGKKAAKNDPSPPAEDESDAIIRCVCGSTVEDESDERKMVCCEKCEAWQHNECMGVTEDDDKLPDEYFCEQCKPKDHKELLAQMKRGEKPWEERRIAREQREEEEEKAKKGKGKKGKKGGRKSTAKKNEADTNGAPIDEGDTTLIEEPPMEAPVEASNAASEVVLESPQLDNNKRKLPEELTQEAKSPSQAVGSHSCTQDSMLTPLKEPASKLRKLSTPTTTTKPSLPPPSRRKSGTQALAKRDSDAKVLDTTLVTKVEDLQSEDRRRVATALCKLFASEAKKAQKEGSVDLTGQNTEDLGRMLGLAVEFAVYLNFWGPAHKASDQYGGKFRAILHNVKHNSSLRDRLLSGALEPNDLSKMSHDDMASKELQEKKAEMVKEAEKQHMLIQEEGPRIRRTHKGEELVEGEAHLTDGADTTFSPPIRKRPSDIDTTMKEAGSPEPPSAMSPDAVELPEGIGAMSPTNNQPPSLDTAPTPVSAGGDRRSASTFNIQDVFSSVKGPDPETQRARQPSRQSESAAPPVKQQPDAEIDQLLKDEEPEDEEPYSPVEFTAEPGSAIWHGKMAMSGIASFSGKAKYVAGADLSASLPWPQLIPSSLTIEGRIDVERASEYLCGLRWSHTTDVVVVSVTPNENPDDLAQFNKLFRYFTERKRYGVVGKSPVPSVRDTYVVPLEAGISEKPDYINLLEHCTIEDPSPERMLLLTFVVKTNNSPSAQQTPRGPDAASIASPIGTSANQAASLGAHAAFQNSPTPSMPLPPSQQYHQFAGSQPQGQQPYMAPYAQQQHQSPYPLPPQQQMQNGPTGIEAARQALGDLASVPVVNELLAEAPMTRIPEFMVVKELLERHPETQTDLAMLKQLLTMKMQGQGQ